MWNKFEFQFGQDLTKEKKNNLTQNAEESDKHMGWNTLNSAKTTCRCTRVSTTGNTTWWNTIFWKYSGQDIYTWSPAFKEKGCFSYFYFTPAEALTIIRSVPHTFSRPCAAPEKADNPPTNGDDTREPALTCCIIVWGESWRGMEGWWQGEKKKKKKSRGKLGWFLSGAPLKMQEDCYSTQMWLLFPACIRCLGNTKLIVTARRERELSVLKQASLWSLPPLLSSTLVTPVSSLADTLFDFHLFVCVTRHLCQQLFCDTLTFLASFPFSPMSLFSSHLCCACIYFSHFPSPAHLTGFSGQYLAAVQAKLSFL